MLHRLTSSECFGIPNDSTTNQALEKGYAGRNATVMERVLKRRKTRSITVAFLPAGEFRYEKGAYNGSMHTFNNLMKARKSKMLICKTFCKSTFTHFY